MGKDISTSMLAIAVATAAGLTGAPVFAQASSPPAAKEREAGIADIIVTATRREQTLQSVAIPVSAIGADELDAKGVSNVQDLTKLLPAVKIGSVAGGGVQVTARGVGTFGGNNFNEPGVSVNLDGAYVARNQGPDGIFYDVARVELLKGPQGTLYGRNSTGGVLSVITNDPTDRAGGNVSVEIGNYGLKRISGVLNAPLAEGVSLRVAATGVERDGYLSDGYNDASSYAGRAKLKLDPTPELSIILEASFVKVNGKGYAQVFTPFVDPNNPYLGPSSAASNALIAAVPGAGPILPRITANGFLNNWSRGFRGAVNYDFGGAKATLIVNNVLTTNHYLQYGPAFPVRDDTRTTPGAYTTAELRLASAGTGPFKWVIGGLYLQDKNISNAFVDQGTTRADTRNLVLRNKSYSGFGEGTYAVLPNLRFTLGGRYTSDSKSLDGITITPQNTAGPPCVAPSVPTTMTSAIPGLLCVTTNQGSTTFSKFTYKIGIDADIGPSSLIYANYTTGFKSGGFFASANTAAAGAFPNNAYRPEEIRAWTIGSKNRFFDNTLQINAEGFYWKYKDKQVTHLGLVSSGNSILLVENAGSATVYGAEIEAVWQPTKNDNFNFGIQYLNTNYDSFAYVQSVPAWAAPFAPGSPAPTPVTGCAFTPTVGFNGAPRGTGRAGLSTIDCSGRNISLAPEWVINAGYQHTFELPGGATIVPSISTRYESGFWIGEEYFVGQYQSPFTNTDASLTFATANRGFSVTAFINNIEDKAVGMTSTLQATVRRSSVTLRAPRTFGVRGSVKF